MAASRIKGITIEIGGDTTKLQTALKGVNTEIRNTQQQLKDVEKLLKLDPGNTELLAQKQKLLKDAVQETKEKLETLKTAAEQAKASGTPIISSMGAGNKMDPTGFMVTDIYKTSVCPLAKVMRRELKKRGIKKLKVVYSQEKPMTPIDDMAISCKSHCICPPGTKRKCTQRRQVPGSNAFVPSVVGLIIAGEVVKDLIK